MPRPCIFALISACKASSASSTYSPLGNIYSCFQQVGLHDGKVPGKPILAVIHTSFAFLDLGGRHYLGKQPYWPPYSPYRAELPKLAELLLVSAMDNFAKPPQPMSMNTFLAQVIRSMHWLPGYLYFRILSVMDVVRMGQLNQRFDLWSQLYLSAAPAENCQETILWWSIEVILQHSSCIGWRGNLFTPPNKFHLDTFLSAVVWTPGWRPERIRAMARYALSNKDSEGSSKQYKE